LVKTFQWVDWRQLRFADRSSSEYRDAVARLAQRLVDANRQIVIKEVENRTTVAVDDSLKETPDTGEPGMLDLIAAGETALPEWAEIVTAIGSELEGFNTLVTGATEDLDRADRAGKGAAGRLVVARKLAQGLAGPADRIFELANKYASRAYEVDAAIRTLIAAAPGEIARDPEQKDTVCEFFNAMTLMTRSSQEAVEGLGQMVDTLSGAESISRDLRPPIQQLKRGITILIEATAITEDWARAIEESPVDCS
jgi:hypothetical protein